MMMVLCCVGAFAQYENALTPVTDLSQLNDETFYTVRTARCALIYNPAQPNALNTTNATGLTVEYDPGDTNQHFYIKQNEGKYYLFSVGADKYVKHEGNQSVFVDDIASASELSITETGNSEYPWLLKLAGNGINTQIKGQFNTGMVINSWVTVDEGNSFKIESIDLSQINYYEVKYASLSQAIDAVNAALNVNDLKKGVNVGDKYGNYKPEIVEYFLAMDDSAKKVYDLVIEEESFDVLEEMYPDYHMIDTFIADYVGAKDSVIENTVPREIPDIEAGYYTISSALTFIVEEYQYTYWTQEEADNYNKELGLDEGAEGWVNAGDKKDSTLVTNAQGRKALYEYNGAANWGDQKETADFLWKIEKGDSAKAYKIINMNQSMTFARISQSSPVYMEKNDTSEYYITWWGKDTLVDNREVDLIAIRNILDGPNSYRHIHCNNHNSGKGKSGNIVGWIGGAEASQWFLTPVDEETAQKWMDSQKPVLELRAKIKLGDSIAAAFPAQLKIAQDSITVVGQSASQFYSPYSVNDGQSVPNGKTIYDFLIDGKPGTYWHSDWANKPSGNLVHYLQIESAEPLTSEYKVRMVRRNVGGNQITKLAVRGYDANDANLTYEQGVDLGIIELPLNTDALTEPFFSTSFKVNGSKVIRFYCAETQASTSGGQAELGFWHAAEFNVYLSEPYTRYETTQYDVRKNEADALDAAVKKWNEGKFRDDSLALISDAPFAAAYEEIVATGKAWGDVYVDPTELREAIANVPAENMFPIGTNPGEWASLDLVPVLKAGVDAEAYNASGAYTKEKTAEWLKAISDADATSYANANKVKTGVWYQFAFPSEAMFDEFGWDKVAGEKTVTKAENTNTGVDIVRCEGIFDKVIAAGRGITNYTFEANGKIDTVTQYTARIIPDADYYEDQNMFFFSRGEAALIEDGANLFRFIEATDSSYIIQNQATGLFLRGGHPCTLSPIPTYWSTKALGAGGNLISFTDVLGNTTSNHKNLHGQNSDRRLVCWEANTVGSRSMILIEEVEAVTEEPATEYMKEIWPGKVYAMTMPVDVTLVDDLDFGIGTYGAELNVGEEDTTLVLRPITDETIKAGCPFLMIATPEYIAQDSAAYESVAEATERLKAEIDPEYPGKAWKALNNNTLNGKLTEMYYIALMDHGMEVDTVARWNGSLRGTMKADTVAAGKGYVVEENKFAYVKETADIEAYSAYVDANFDPETTTEGGLVIDLNGENIDDTGINAVLDKVAKSGNIYNAAGQIVGKGNLNTINSLPAGIYIVNGVKVTKR